MMDEYFMHLKELYCEIRAANRLKVILTGIFIIKAGGGSCLKSTLKYSVASFLRFYGKSCKSLYLKN